MSSIQAIGRAIEREQKVAVLVSAVSYQSKFWRSWFQRIGYWLSELIPAVRVSRAKTNAALLELVRIYKPQILAQYQQYVENFERWERENRGPQLMGSSEALRLERTAGAEAIRLTQELQQKLTDAGWTYRNLPLLKDLIQAWEGYMRADAVDTYWEQIEGFLVMRSTR